MKNAAAAFLTVLLLLAPALAAGGDAQVQTASIEEIVRNPGRFIGRRVMVAGRFAGWQARGPHPGLSRSDWVLQDSTGTIYVHGPSAGLRPHQDEGRPVIVFGRVQITAAKIIYLNGEKVEATDQLQRRP